MPTESVNIIYLARPPCLKPREIARFRGLMSALIEFKKNKIFSLIEAQDLLPLIRRITGTAVEQVSLLENQAHQLPTDSTERTQLEGELNSIIRRWSDKVSKLGAIPKGFWLVDFDNGEGYFCWKYGEDDVNFFHEYSTGFGGRTRIN